MTSGIVLTHRFGLGGVAPAADVASLGWIEAQMRAYEPRPAAIAALPSAAAVSREVWTHLVTRRREQRALKAAAKAKTGEAEARRSAGMVASDAPNPVIAATRDFARLQRRDRYGRAVAARLSSAVNSPAPFVERMVHFWSNHFAVSADGIRMVGLAGPYEFEAIRPHVLGSFRDMLFAAARHPAMLIYLDQVQSIGPASPVGARRNARAPGTSGLNENLAREILELHTLGVRTGYGQADVTAFAAALSGWSVPGYGGRVVDQVAHATGTDAAAVFAPALHEPGAKTVMGKSYGQDGAAQSTAILADLAAHPATARHIATKLARYFAGDDPSNALVTRLTDAFTRSDGDLPTVYRALAQSPECLAPAPVKFLSPWEWMVASQRLVGRSRDADHEGDMRMMGELGKGVWRPGSPAGFEDSVGRWAAPDAVLRRVEAANKIASRLPRDLDARALARRAYGDLLTATTDSTLAAADSPGEAVALLLVAPEAMRR